MKKKLISILLAVALVAGLLSVPALAEGEADTGVYIAGVQLEVDKPYYNADFWPLIPAPDTTPDPSPTLTYSPAPTYSPTPTDYPLPTPAASLEGGSAVYGGMTRGADSQDWNAYLTRDEETGYTLTIKDLSVMGVANLNESAAIYSRSSLTIVLQGVNSAIGADGDGELVAGITAGDLLVIEGNGTLTVTAGNTNDDSSYGIFAAIVKITDGATVIATGGSTDGRSAGIRSDKVEITGATVIATGGNVSGPEYGSYGISISYSFTSSDIDINSATVVARAGTVGGGFSGDRCAFDGSVSLTNAKLAGAVTSGAEQDTPTLDSVSQYTSLAIVPDSWTRNALLEANDNTYTLNDDTYIVSVDTNVIAIDTDTTIDTNGNTLLAVSLFEGEGDTAGIYSTASVTLNGSIIAVGGLATASDGTNSSSGFKVPDEAQNKTVTINGSLLAVGAGTPSGDGVGYSSGADTAVNGTLIGVGVSGTNTCGLNMQGDLTVNSGGAVLGYAGPAGASEPTAAGINVTGTLFTSGKVTGVGATYGLRGAASVDGGSYFGKTAAVDALASPAYSYVFLNEKGEIPEDYTTEQYLTVGKTYVVTFNMDDSSMGLPLLHGQSVSALYAEEVEAFTAMMEKNGYTFDGWYESEDEGETLSAAPYDFDAPVTDDVHLYPKWTAITPPTYPPTVTQPENGTIAVAPTYPRAGDPVTVTVTPDEGYETTEVTVTDRNGKPVEVTDNSDGTYTFTQPAGRVTITAQFTQAKADDPHCPQDHTCPIAPFDDADPKAWYHDGVHYCIERGLMIGTGDSEFQPHALTTRGTIVTILHRLEGEPEATTTGTFADVADGLWYTEAVEWAAANGIVEGDGENFYPEAILTREQAATILYRYVQYLGGGFTGAWAFRLDFADLAEMNEWAYEGVSWCVMNGIIEGDDNGLLRPGDGLERCEMATLVYRLCEDVLK